MRSRRRLGIKLVVRRNQRRRRSLVWQGRRSRRGRVFWVSCIGWLLINCDCSAGLIREFTRKRWMTLVLPPMISCRLPSWIFIEVPYALVWVYRASIYFVCLFVRISKQGISFFFQGTLCGAGLRPNFLGHLSVLAVTCHCIPLDSDR